MDTLYLEQIRSDRANSFAVPFNTSYAIFWNFRWPVTDWDPTAASWKIDLISSDSGTKTEVSGSGLTTVKKEDRVLFYNMIADGSAPQTVYSLGNGVTGAPPSFAGYTGFTNRIGFPCVYFFTSGTLVFKQLREVNEPSVNQITSSRFLVTWWSNFYSDYDVDANGYTDDATKMILTSNTTRPVTEYKRAMIGAFVEMRPVNIHIKYPGAAEVSHFYNIFFPVFEKPTIINTMLMLNEEVSGAGLFVAQAIADGSGGTVTAKKIQHKADLSATPNFEQTGDALSLTYFKT